jgi:hypothetical protein
MSTKSLQELLDYIKENEIILDDEMNQEILDKFKEIRERNQNE